MSELGFLYLDANALAYAFKAGGAALVDTYLRTSENFGFRPKITDVVLDEIERRTDVELKAYVSDRIASHRDRGGLACAGPNRLDHDGRYVQDGCAASAALALGHGKAVLIFAVEGVLRYRLFSCSPT
jgi:hypothetical protein